MNLLLLTCIPILSSAEAQFWDYDNAGVELEHQWRVSTLYFSIMTLCRPRAHHPAPHCLRLLGGDLRQRRVYRPERHLRRGHGLLGRVGRGLLP